MTFCNFLFFRKTKGTIQSKKKKIVWKFPNLSLKKCSLHFWTNWTILRTFKKVWKNDLGLNPPPRCGKIHKIFIFLTLYSSLISDYISKIIYLMVWPDGGWCCWLFLIKPRYWFKSPQSFGSQPTGHRFPHYYQFSFLCLISSVSWSLWIRMFRLGRRE